MASMCSIIFMDGDKDIEINEYKKAFFGRVAIYKKEPAQYNNK